jgi:hypothetical protein
MRREGFADRHEGLPLIAHQMDSRVRRPTQHPVCLALGEIRYNMGSGVAGAGASPLVNRRRSLHDGEHGCLRRPRMAFPSPSETGAIRIVARIAADVEFILLDDAIERLLAGQ